jgi:hemoglobin/transferrin/lactoferrin receptor protein
MRYTTSLLLLYTLFLWPASAVKAQDNEPLRLPAVVVSARVWPETTDRLPTSVAVWDPARDGWGTVGGVPDLAAETPGVNRTGDGPWSGDLSIRGLSGDRIVVTLDGARLVTANDLAARMSLIDWATVERVEVFKGPVSALYGSGSLGGIVNIVMSRPEYAQEPQRRQRARIAGVHNPDGWALLYGVEQLAPRLYLSATLTARDADAYRDGNGDRVRNTQYGDESVSLRMGYQWRPGAETDILVQHYLGEDIGVPGSGRAPLPARADVTYDEARRFLARVSHEQLMEGIYWQKSQLQVYFQQIQRDVRIDGFPAGPLEKITPVGRHDTVGARWLNEWIWENHLIGGGFDTWRRELDSTRRRYTTDGRVLFDRPLPPASEWSYGAFIEDRWTALRDVSVTAGTRLDGLYIENETTPQWEAGSSDDLNWNAHAGVRWQAGEQNVLRAVAATGYRAPSLEERYQFLVLGDGRVKLGQPDLASEQSQFAELGWEWSDAGWTAEVTGFINALRNRIGEEVVDATTIRNASIERARIHGVEALLRWQLDTLFSVEATLAYIRGDDTKANEPLPDISPLTGHVGVRYQPTRAWQFRLRQVYAARQDRVPTGMAETPGWVRFDASASYTVERSNYTHEIRLDVLNLTDTAWRDHLSTWRGNPHNEPGRSIQVVWETRF